MTDECAGNVNDIKSEIQEQSGKTSIIGPRRAVIADGQNTAKRKGQVHPRSKTPRLLSIVLLGWVARGISPTVVSSSVAHPSVVWTMAAGGLRPPAISLLTAKSKVCNWCCRSFEHRYQKRPINLDTTTLKSKKWRRAAASWPLASLPLSLHRGSTTQAVR